MKPPVEVYDTTAPVPTCSCRLHATCLHMDPQRSECRHIKSGLDEKVLIRDPVRSHAADILNLYEIDDVHRSHPIGPVTRFVAFWQKKTPFNLYVGLPDQRDGVCDVFIEKSGETTWDMHATHMIFKGQDPTTVIYLEHTGFWTNEEPMTRGEAFRRYAAAALLAEGHQWECRQCRLKLMTQVGAHFPRTDPDVIVTDNDRDKRIVDIVLEWRWSHGLCGPCDLQQSSLNG